MYGTLAGLGSRAVSSLGSSAFRAGGAGLAGGMLLDDVPFVGPAVDPTEGGNGGGIDLTLVLVLAIVLLVAWQVGGSS